MTASGIALPTRPEAVDAWAADLTAFERRELIVSMVDDGGRVGVADLTARFKVTEASIRRDLAALETAGRLKRVHGGAVSFSPEPPDSVYAAKARKHTDEKSRIADAAARMIERGQVVLFDSGTTVAMVASSVPAPLRSRHAFTAVTYSLPVIEEIGGWDAPHLVCVGGLFLPEYRSFVGPQAIADLRDLTVDIAFIGCDGLSTESGLTTPHMLVAEMGATSVARARRIVALADSSKIGRRGFLPITPLTSVDVLVTDARADSAALAEIRDAGVEVVVT